MRTGVRAGGAIVALGEGDAVAGFALAGVAVRRALGADEVRQGWHELSDAAVVILTPAAAEALGEDRWAHSAPLTVVMPR